MQHTTATPAPSEPAVSWRACAQQAEGEPEPEPGPPADACPKPVARRSPVNMLQPQTMLPAVKLEYSIHNLTGVLART
jgi:hypothetical protein